MEAAAHIASEAALADVRALVDAGRRVLVCDDSVFDACARLVHAHALCATVVVNDGALHARIFIAAHRKTAPAYAAPVQIVAEHESEPLALAVHAASAERNVSTQMCVARNGYHIYSGYTYALCIPREPTKEDVSAAGYMCSLGATVIVVLANVQNAHQFAGYAHDVVCLDTFKRELGKFLVAPPQPLAAVVQTQEASFRDMYTEPPHMERTRGPRFPWSDALVYVMVATFYNNGQPTTSEKVAKSMNEHAYVQKELAQLGWKGGVLKRHIASKVQGLEKKDPAFSHNNVSLDYVRSLHAKLQQEWHGAPEDLALLQRV